MTGEGDKLVQMALEIHQFFRHRGEAAPAEAARHLRQFWAPAMRRDFLAHVKARSRDVPAEALNIASELERPGATPP